MWGNFTKFIESAYFLLRPLFFPHSPRFCRLSCFLTNNFDGFPHRYNFLFWECLSSLSFTSQLILSLTWEASSLKDWAFPGSDRWAPVSLVPWYLLFLGIAAVGTLHCLLVSKPNTPSIMKHTISVCNTKEHKKTVNKMAKAYHLTLLFLTYQRRQSLVKNYQSPGMC